MRRTTNTWKQRKKTHRRDCCSVDGWNMKRDVRFEFVHVLETVSDIDLTLVNPSKHSRGQSCGFREAMLVFPDVDETIVELLLCSSLDRTGSRNHPIDQIRLGSFDPLTVFRNQPSTFAWILDRRDHVKYVQFREVNRWWYLLLVSCNLK